MVKYYLEAYAYLTHAHKVITEFKHEQSISLITWLNSKREINNYSEDLVFV
jgi:hypothetical protein